MSAPTTPPLWQIVPLSAFELPAMPAQEVATKRLRAFWRLFQAGDAEARTPARAEDDLHLLSEARLADLFPPIAWRFAADALESWRDAWAQSDGAAEGLRFFLGPPQGGQNESLRIWAARRGWTLVQPPTSEQILSADPAWLAECVKLGDGWVLPELERCFLRHGEGLTLVRRFLDLAVEGRLGTGVIGCDSWAWAFLQYIWTVPQPEIFTLQSFDGFRLAAFFRRFTRDPSGRRLCVRNARTGDDVLPEAAADAEAGVDVSADLKRLAAHCRGNLGIAWRYWRAGLRSAPDPAIPADASRARLGGEALSPRGASTLWWTPRPREHEMPAEMDDEFVHVLHALLLHNGLPRPVLSEILPESRARLGGILARLKSLGLIECVDNTWRVAALGYAATRELLRGRSYLIDPL